MSDQFFEEEEDIARAERASSQSRQRAGSQTKAAAVKTVPVTRESAAAPTSRKPPSFALVVAIALVALVLGICIGYFLAMSVVGNQDVSSADAGATAAGTSATQADEGGSDEASMPEGHPDISSFLNEDGTVNQEALDEYKAQRAQQSADEESEGDDEAADSEDDADAGETTGSVGDATGSGSDE